jgi:hypothetical protein
MTKEILKQYATEDLAILIENGVLAITNTVYNDKPVFFNYENKTFTASLDGREVLNTTKKSLVISMMQNCYKAY